MKIPCRPTRIVFNVALGLALFFTLLALFSPMWTQYDALGYKFNCLSPYSIGANGSADWPTVKNPQGSGVLAERYRLNGTYKYRLFNMKKDKTPAQYKATAGLYFIAFFIALFALILGMALCLGVRNDSMSYPALAIPITMMAFVAFVLAVTALSIYSSFCYHTFKLDTHRAGWGLYMAAVATFFYLVACVISIFLLVNVIHRTAVREDSFDHRRHHRDHRDPKEVRDEYFRHHREHRDGHHRHRHRSG